MAASELARLARSAWRSVYGHLKLTEEFARVDAGRPTRDGGVDELVDHLDVHDPVQPHDGVLVRVEEFLSGG